MRARLLADIRSPGGSGTLIGCVRTVVRLGLAEPEWAVAWCARVLVRHTRISLRTEEAR